jgi:Chalcone isomerase-like
MNRRIHLATVTICCALTCSIAIIQARDLAGVSMPEVVRVAVRQLRLNGMGVGTEKTFFKVYVVGFYLERKTTDARTAITSDQVKRIALTMLRDVSRQKFVQAVEKGMVLNSGPAISTLRARLNVLEESLPALKKGDILDFTYIPGTGTLVRGQAES